MDKPLHFALMGFAGTEKAQIQSALRALGGDGCNADWTEEPEQADLILVNADDRWTARNLRLRGSAAQVLLIGADDAGTGWPVVSRPLVPQAVLDAATRLLPVQRPVADLPSDFAATEPFAPLLASGPAAPASGFEVTRPFERPIAVGLARPKTPPRQRPAYESINAQSVLLWRDEKVGVPGPVDEPTSAAAPTEPAASPAVVPKIHLTHAGMPAMAGFEATREAESQFPDRVPANWRDLARQRDDERRGRTPPVVVEPLSSSFADPSDHPTSPPGLIATGRVPAILLVGGLRLAGSSLIRELRGLGSQVDHAQDLAAALERLAAQVYAFAYLDDRSLKGRTRSVCRALRRRARALNLNLTLVVLARDDGVLRRLLARWAGCDTWMTLPLDRDRLARFLQDGSRLRTGP